MTKKQQLTKFETDIREHHFLIYINAVYWQELLILTLK
jgi:hypothetical protein